MSDAPAVVTELEGRFGADAFTAQETRSGFPTLWTSRERLPAVLKFLKTEVDRPFGTLYDLTAIDERFRKQRDGQPDSDFTVLYHLLSYGRNEDLCLKVGLTDGDASLPTATGLWSSANWYEREVWDMFGVRFDGHPALRRILMPLTWEGHPLRKEHPARATEMGPFQLPDDRQDREQEALRFRPEDWGMKRSHEGTDFMFLNVGPQHPGTHGVIRIILQLDGEEIVDCLPEIGFHHRGAEKMGERQSWHSFIPYTDRIDYLGGVMNNLAYVLSVEQLAGIDVPDRAQVIRVMMSEFFRIASHLVWYGTFAQDVGSLSTVFYTFNDRERIFDIVQAVCGGRMHPELVPHRRRRPRSAQGLAGNGAGLRRLPAGPARGIRQDRDAEPPVQGAHPGHRRLHRGGGHRLGRHRTGPPGLRLRVGLPQETAPTRDTTSSTSTCPPPKRATATIRAVCGGASKRIRQSLRIIDQCLKNMPPGHYKGGSSADHAPPRKERTMHDIETLINHFLSVSWGPVIPAGESFMGIEATKGNNGYRLVSDGGTIPYRVRIRTPSFAHMQMIPLMSRGTHGAGPAGDTREHRLRAGGHRAGEARRRF